MDPQEFYNQIREMVRSDAEKAAQDTYNTLGTRYGVATVPAHTHTNLDANRVNYKDVVQGTKLITGISAYDASGSETVILGGIYNPTRISFAGFAANNADGTPATKRAVINGEINFGECYEATNLSSPINLNTVGAPKPFMQSSNYMFTDTASLSNTRVGATEGAGTGTTAYFIYANDSATATFARAQVTSYDNQKGLLTIQLTYGTNVRIQGAISIT